jgi:uncharacterized protein GlcG (DUF336 family)
VFDRGGHLTVARRMDGNTSGIVDFAIAKARQLLRGDFLGHGWRGQRKSRPALQSLPT